MSQNGLTRHDPGAPTSLSPMERYELYPFPADFGQPFASRKHLREYVRVIVKRKWVILGCIVTALAAAAVYTFRQTPIYQASSKLEIDLQTSTVLPYQDFSNSQADYYLYDEFLQTQIKHITSRTLARRVALAAGLDREVKPGTRRAEGKGWLASLLPARAEKKKSEDRPLTREERIEQAIGTVRGGLIVTPVRNSRVVDIAYNSPDPELAARIVNHVVSEYIDYNFQAKYDATTRATEFLQKQLVDLKAKVEESEAALVDYARKHNILNVGEKQDVITQTLGDINTNLSQARAARMEKESVYRTLGNASPENFPQAMRTPMIEQLIGKLLADEQELAKISAQLGPAMPQVKQMESRVRQGREQLQREQRLAIDHARTEYETALAREKLLSDAFDRQKVLANQLSESSIHYNILRREVDTSKQLYDGLLQRMKEAGVAAGLKSSNIRVVDQAQVPDAPVSPNPARNLALATMMGMMAGFGLALFLNYLDNTVKTPEDALIPR